MNHIAWVILSKYSGHRKLMVQSLSSNFERPDSLERVELRKVLCEIHSAKARLAFGNWPH